MSVRAGLAFPLALAAMAVIGAVNLRTDEPQPAAALILLSAAALTVLNPRWAAFWAVLTAAAVPLSYAFAAPLSLPNPYPPEHPATTVIALVPAVLGVVAGWSAARLIDRPST